MMRGFKKSAFAFTAIAAATSLVLAGCSGGGTDGSATQPTDGGGGEVTIPIGATLPLTGFGAPYGISMQKGLEIGIEQAQAALDGVTFDVKMTDSQALAGPAVTEGRKLMADEGVPVVVTAFSAPPLAQLAIAEEYQVPLMNGGGNTPDLPGHEWLFNNAFMVEQGGFAMMKYAHEEMGVNSVAVVVDSSYPESTVAAYEEIWKSVAPDGSIAVEFIPNDTTDAGPNLDKLLATNPDAIFLSANGAALSLVLNQLVQRNVDIPVLSNDGAILGAPEAATLPFPVYYANASAVASPEFTAAFGQAYDGEEPDFLALANYNIGLIIGQVVEKLRAEGQEITGANFQKVLADTNNVYIVDGGAELRYNDRHIADQDAVIIKYENGTGETIAEGISTQ